MRVLWTSLFLLSGCSEPTPQATVRQAVDWFSGRPTCGDGIQDSSEECDDGPGNGLNVACTPICERAVCGDYLVQEGIEACDDGNLVDGDGCDSDCTLSTEWLVDVPNARFIGEREGDRAGREGSVHVGDVDGDGFGDVLVSAIGNVDGAPFGGAAYLVPGPRLGSYNLSRAPAKLIGSTEGGSFSAYVGGAGDVNGDGFNDFIVGWGGQELGAALYLGPVVGTSAAQDAAAFRIVLTPNDSVDSVGPKMVVAGDLNDDGEVDFMVEGRRRLDGVGIQNAAYVFFGPLSGVVETSQADAVLISEQDFSDSTISHAGDVNNDGIDDVLVARVDFDPDDGRGVVYLLLGPVSGEIDLDTTANARIVGDRFDELGLGVKGVGDFDGDGFDDIAASARREDAVYLFRGPLMGDLGPEDAHASFVIEDEGFGTDFDACDVNGDGELDMVVGAPRFGFTEFDENGKVYLWYGPLSGEYGRFSEDHHFLGRVGTEVGTTVSCRGDLDADGRDDLIMGQAGLSDREGLTYLMSGNRLVP